MYDSQSYRLNRQTSSPGEDGRDARVSKGPQLAVNQGWIALVVAIEHTTRLLVRGFTIGSVTIDIGGLPHVDTCCFQLCSAGPPRYLCTVPFTVTVKPNKNVVTHIC